MGLAVLMYHEVSNQQSKITTPVEVFRYQMKWLRQSGIEVISFGEVINRILNEKSLPTNAISLTFDDGLAGIYHFAYPILREFGYPGLLFLVTDYCNQKNDWPGQPKEFCGIQMVNWTEVLEMNANGFSIGAHTLSHPRLDQLARAELELQIIGSKQAIQEHIDQEVEWFAYPFGRHNPDIRALVMNHFRGACTTHLGLVGTMSDPYQIPRLEAHYFQAPRTFRMLSSRVLPSYIVLRRMLRSVGGIVYDRPWT